MGAATEIEIEEDDLSWRWGAQRAVNVTTM